MNPRIASLILLISSATGALSAQTHPIAQELSSLRDQVTARAWLQDHPEEKVEPFTIRDANQDVEGWCARTTKKWQADGLTLVRHAYFYLPQNFLLPTESTPHPALIMECTLGVVWVESAGTPDAIDAEIGRAEQELSAQFGLAQHTLGPTEALFGVAFWKPFSIWNESTNSARYAIAKNREQRLIGIAWLSSSHLTQRDLNYDPMAQALEPLRLAERFLQQTGMPEAQIDRMRRLMARERKFQTGASVSDRLAATEVADVLAEWVSLAEAVPADAKSAALLVADQALEAGMQSSTLADREPKAGSGNSTSAEASREKLHALGATFNYSELGGAYEYQHDWMRRAQATGSNSDVEEAAFLYLLNRGFDTSGVCAQGAEQFRKVITEGKSYLAAHPRSKATGEILLTIGNAYRDIVALAKGSVPEYADAQQYVPEEQAARKAAISNYRQAIAAATDNSVKQEAQRAAWELIAGIDPATTRFYCIYD